MSERQIEMHWYCSTCHHDNRGRDMVCSKCGKPKGDEEYLMPNDTRSAPTVTDPELLKKAHAGPNWRCRYCVSAQRRNDGCCAQCGSDQSDAIHTDKTLDHVDPLPEEDPWKPVQKEGSAQNFERSLHARAFRAERVRQATTLGASLVGVAGLVWLGTYMFVPHNVNVKVQSVSWEQVAHVERYQKVNDDGWSPPGDAVEVHDEAPRVHHYDHRRIGSHVEHYTVQVTCGQTCRPIPRVCTTTPKSCSENCTSNKNGFATCRTTCTGGGTSCSGGGQSCTTNYCSEGRSRTVDDYQDFPIFAPYYSWKVWRWRHNRDVPLRGTTTETRWPNSDDEFLNANVGPGEQERESGRNGSYKVVFSDGKETWDKSPGSESDFQRYSVGSRWVIKVDRMGIIHQLWKNEKDSP